MAYEPRDHFATKTQSPDTQVSEPLVVVGMGHSSLAVAKAGRQQQSPERMTFERLRLTPFTSRAACRGANHVRVASGRQPDMARPSQAKL